MDSKTDILSTIAYFDLFHYPVMEKEIYFFLPHPVSPALFESALEELVAEELIFAFEGYYTIRNDKEWVSPDLFPNTTLTKDPI